MCLCSLSPTLRPSRFADTSSTFPTEHCGSSSSDIESFPSTVLVILLSISIGSSNFVLNFSSNSSNKVLFLHLVITSFMRKFKTFKHCNCYNLQTNSTIVPGTTLRDSFLWNKQ
ncbi:unnamed protein product [Lepeophtheirus salmonis]|uniref:(salmon louse) hypothetical protein n=1 Tax=Lepeophtheirus salmonis TaxID=72036 RepID=A0A7R8CB90_LEPSM|nr:unnamed protein product [Lepeophtheirus salmonis]CAF2758349.1 unnamed protein product [Lepeophtheirus salmonis]